MEKEEILISVTELQNHEYDIVVEVDEQIPANTLIMGALSLVELAIESTNITLEEIVQIYEKDEWYK